MPCTTPLTNNYVYDSANRLTSVNGQTYTWDNNGNLLNDGTSAYTYDAANRLTSVVGGGNTSTYTYSGLGDRLSQTVNGATTNYVLDMNAGLTQVLADGTNTYLYGNGRIGELQPAGFAYHLGDGLGSVRQLVDEGGAVRMARSYEAYGNMLGSAGSGSSVFQFAGEQRDAATGFTFLRARYYNGGIGRFFQQDAWAGDFESPLSLNKYVYANGNPVLYTDPSGQWCVMGFSWGPGDPCTQQQQEEWARNYQAAANIFYTLGGPWTQENAAFAAGFINEFFDAMAVVPVMTLTRCTINLAQTGEFRDFENSDPYYLAGRYMGRHTAVVAGMIEIGGAIAGIGSGTTISLSGIGAAIGVPTIAGSVALGAHGALVVAHVAARNSLDPLPPIYHMSATQGTGGSKPPIPRPGEVTGAGRHKGQPPPKGVQGIYEFQDKTRGNRWYVGSSPERDLIERIPEHFTDGRVTSWDDVVWTELPKGVSKRQIEIAEQIRINQVADMVGGRANMANSVNQNPVSKTLWQKLLASGEYRSIPGWPDWLYWP